MLMAEVDQRPGYETFRDGSRISPRVQRPIRQSFNRQCSVKKVLYLQRRLLSY